MNEYYFEESDEEKDSDDEYGDLAYKNKIMLSDNYRKLSLRASTPARPLTEIEEFRRSSDFLLLEHTVMCASQFIQKEDKNMTLILLRDSEPVRGSLTKLKKCVR